MPSLSYSEFLTILNSLSVSPTVESADKFFLRSGNVNYDDCRFRNALINLVVRPSVNSGNYEFAVYIINGVISRSYNKILDKFLIKILLKNNMRDKALERSLHIYHFDGDVDSLFLIVQHYVQEKRYREAIELVFNASNQINNDRTVYFYALACLRVQGAVFASSKICFECVSDVRTFEILIDVFMKYYLFRELETLFELIDKNKITSRKISYAKAVRFYSGGGGVNDSFEILNYEFNDKSPDKIIDSFAANLLIKQGNFDFALKIFQVLVSTFPENDNFVLKLARTLKFLGRYDDAAVFMVESLRRNPDSRSIRRYAVSSLNQAKKFDDAIRVFNEGIIERKKSLPYSFSDLMSELSKFEGSCFKNDHVVSWGLDIVRKLGSFLDDDGVYKWVNSVSKQKLLDEKLVDWLEVYPERADEAMAYLDDISLLDDIVKKNENGNGVFFASAHLGCMFAGPLVLELLDRPHVWLASTASISSMPYADTLLSTSEATESDVARKVVRALKENKIVTIAVDGAMNPSAPTVKFFGRSVTYSDFLSRLAWKYDVPSVFVIPYWSGEVIKLHCREFNSPNGYLTMNDYVDYWRSAYFEFINEFISLNPNSIRLGGGIWR